MEAHINHLITHIPTILTSVVIGALAAWNVAELVIRKVPQGPQGPEGPRGMVGEPGKNGIDLDDVDQLESLEYKLSGFR